MANAPMLFAWGRDGVPGEIERHIRAAGAENESGDEQSERTIRSIGYSKSGVENLCDSLLADLRSDREPARGKKAHFPKLSHEIATWCFLLHAYCTKYGEPAPEKLLWLTFESLGLKEGQPSVAVERRLSLPENISNVTAFLQAAALDGEADARGENLSLSILEKQTGASRQTVRRWREMQTYRERREAAAFAEKSARG